MLQESKEMGMKTKSREMRSQRTSKVPTPYAKSSERTVGPSLKTTRVHSVGKNAGLSSQYSFSKM